MLFLGQYLEKFCVEDYSFDCIRSMTKFLCTPEICPIGHNVKT